MLVNVHSTYHDGTGARFYLKKGKSVQQNMFFFEICVEDELLKTETKKWTNVSGILVVEWNNNTIYTASGPF